MSLVAELPALDPTEIGMAYLAIGDSNCLPIYLASYLAIYFGIIQSSNKQPVQIPLQIPYGAPPTPVYHPLTWYTVSGRGAVANSTRSRSPPRAESLNSWETPPSINCCDSSIDQ